MSKKVVKNTESHSQWFSRVAILLFVALFGISIYKLYQTSTRSSDVIITEQVQKLKTIFDQIHKDCGIIDFEHEQNYIDFLTVKTFVGSEVGSMNLLYPRQWKGPYVQDNPTIQEKMYVVLHNKGGYYIVPGDGVKLLNDKVVGTDLVLNYDTDMEQAMLQEDALKSEAGSLAVKINVGKNSLTKAFSN